MSTAKVPISDSASLAPPAAWRDHESHGHTVQFYTEDQSLIDGLSRFIGTALGSGDGAIVIATKAHQNALADRLHARGLDTSTALHQGRYLVLEAAETLSRITLHGSPDPALFTEIVGGLITQARAASEGGNSRVVAFGEMVSLLWTK